MRFEQFLKALPSLSNPYALAGYLVIAIVWFGYALSKAKVLSRLSSDHSFAVINLILKYAFRLSILAIILCVGYAGYQTYVGANRDTKPRNSVDQQGGNCSALQNGNGNVASPNCESKAGTK